MDIDGIIIIIHIVYYEYKVISGSEIVNNLKPLIHSIIFIPYSLIWRVDCFTAESAEIGLKQIITLF